ATSQLPHILGVSAKGHNLLEMVIAIFNALPSTNIATLLMGSSALAFLFWSRKGLAPLLQRRGLSAHLAGLVSKAGPVLAVIATIAVVWGANLTDAGVQVVGTIPAGLPQFTLPVFDGALWQQLLISALFISLVGFVESVSVAQTLAAKRRQRIDPN